jgi:hypothetical protein
MDALLQLRDVEDVTNARQTMRHFDFVRKWAHTFQHLERSNVPWTELAFIAKTPYTPHW